MYVYIYVCWLIFIFTHFLRVVLFVCLSLRLGLGQANGSSRGNVEALRRLALFFDFADKQLVRVRVWVCLPTCAPCLFNDFRCVLGGNSDSNYPVAVFALTLKFI